MHGPTARIERLRTRALQKTAIVCPEQELLWARAWLASSNEPWYIMRRAAATAAVLQGLTPVIDADELVVGKYSARPLTDGEQDELARWRDSGEKAVPKAWGQKAHMAVDYEKVLRQGLQGVRQQIALYRSRLEPSRPADLERDAFYRSCLLTLDGVTACSDNYAILAENLAPNATPHRKDELLTIAATCRSVPLNPATTFREAMQAIHFLTFCLCAGQRLTLFQLGRPDRYLLPYYHRDIAAGRITPAEAQELIDCLCIMFNEYTPRGLAVGFMVGGRDAYGSDVTNELTHMFIESIAHTRLAYPGIGLCWNSDTPADLMQRACAVLAQGHSHPALFNDDVITAGLLQAGLPHREACLYVHSTCVEITPVASSNVYVASPYINLLGLLQDLLGVPPVNATAKHKAQPEHPTDFAELLAAYRLRLGEAVRRAVLQENQAQATRRYHGGYPLLSCFVNDCLVQGKDIDHGGARHNWIEPSFVGLANLVDALAAIRQVVFTDQTVSLEELAQALHNNFQDHEELRQLLLTRAPKYGNDLDEVDELAIEVTHWIQEECGRYQTYLGGAFHPGLFCWIMHERLGRDTAASADGRLAEFPLADGAGAAQGRERLGPTAALRSATKWCHAAMLGGIAVNLKFTPPDNLEDATRALQGLVETYLKLGGFEVQVNVMDRATLLKAKKHPELYGDLVVRVAGYSDYFVGLPTRMQDEIILRTEHQLG